MKNKIIKYRITRKGNMFIPQYKKTFLWIPYWCNFTYVYGDDDLLGLPNTINEYDEISKVTKFLLEYAKKNNVVLMSEQIKK